MAAMDFPSSPTDGQVYGNYVYSAANGAWLANPQPQNVAVSSPTAPSNPTANTLWYNTQDGNTYIYYYDGNTYQWVQLKSDSTLSSTLGNRVTTLETYPAGLVPIVPSSVTLGSGTSSTNANGLVTFTSSTSVSLNNVFTSTYTNYKVNVNITSTGGGSGSMAFRLRSAGVDRTTGDYYTSGSQMTAAGSNSAYAATTTFYDVAYLYATTDSYSNYSLEVNDPVPAIRTKIRSLSQGLSSAGGATSWSTSCLHNINQTHDGFTILGTGSSETMTGTVQVYGYR